MDWPAYFRRFSELHGGSPLTWKGRLLFRDGWRYSATDHRGPEWTPRDEEEARELSRIYWKLRLAAVKLERRKLDLHLRGIEEMQREHSIQLQQRVESWDEEHRKRTVAKADLDLTALRGRLEWLTKDAEECESKIKDLSNEDAVAVA